MNDISRICLLGHRKKIATFLMRTFSCRSTFLCVLTPVCNVGGWVRLMLTTDHGHPRAAHRQPQIPHRSSGRMRLTLTYCACALCLEHGPCLSLLAHALSTFRACALLSLIAHARVTFRACTLLSLLAHASYAQSMDLVVTYCACALYV